MRQEAVRLPAGRALRTSSCGLRAAHGIMHVVHAVGERWQSGSDNTVAKMLLRSAVKAALTEAAIAGATALAIPLMGCGAWAWAPDSAANEMLASIAHWAAEPAARQQSGGTLQRIVLIGDHNQLPPVVKNTAFQKYLSRSTTSRSIWPVPDTP